MEQAFLKVLRQTELASGTNLLLGVSGGVDSVVLFDLLRRNAAAFSYGLQVLHLDHQIRSGSATDATFVQILCARWQIPCLVERLDVPAFAREHRLSLETAGRDARRELLLDQASTLGTCRIVLAHHLNDQAETFLLRLLRGTGSHGLQAMRAEQGRWWRPLLGFSQQQILDYARLRQLEWVEDATNLDPAYQRNRIRHQLLPQLNEYNPQITQRLAGLSLQFQQDGDFWQQQVAQLWTEVLVDESDGLRLDRGRLLGCHPALRVRLLREGLRRVRGELAGIESIHLEALEKLLQSDTSQAEIDLPGCWAARRYESLWLRTCAPQIPPLNLPLRVGESLDLPDGRALQAVIVAKGTVEWGAETALTLVKFDADGLSEPLCIRSPQAGDRFRPSGMTGRRKIKDFLIDRKVEREVRRSLPLLLYGDEILWLVGLRRSALFPVGDQTQKILVVRLLDRQIG